MMDKKTIKLPEMCSKHQSLLVHGANYSPEQSWRVLIIAAQVALFQAATSDKKTYEKIGGDIFAIANMGCLACYKPDAFGEIVEVAKSHDIGKIKILGESYLNQPESPPKESEK